MKKERVAAERFLLILKKRPRLGTALDKIYGYHVGQGTLDEFCRSLEAEARESNDGNVWMVLGMVQMQRGQDSLAAESYKKTESFSQKQPLASYYLGKTLVLLGEVDGASEAMRRAIEQKPARADMLAIFQDLGRIYQRSGRNQEALEVWKQLESIFPNDAQVREQIASILAEEGALEAALERYNSLAKRSKDRFRKIEMATRAAQLKSQLGKTDESLKDFETLLAKVNPESWLHRDIRRRIEEVFWSSGDIDGLVAYYTQWVEKHPEDVDAMMRTARVLSVQRRMPEAEKWFRKAIEKAPSKVEPRVAFVEALVTDGHYDRGAKEMGELVAIEPNNPDYIVRWGELVLSDEERPEEQRKTGANEIWRGLLRKRGEDPVSVARVADLLRSSETSEAAIELYRKAIELAPNDPQYREYLGEYFHQLGRKEEAISTWHELATGERETRDNLVRLSEVLSTFRYSDEALAAMAKACGMKPAFGHRARYAELLRLAEKYDESLAQLDLAEPLAEDPELRELVIEERIKNYQASGKLAEQIEQAEADVAGDKANDAEAWRLLALMRDADRKFQLACEAIDKATKLDSGSTVIWETAAMLQERSGRFGDAIASYRKLATLDRRFLSTYLTQIASLEMRVGNTEASLKAGEELIASAPGNSDHYRFFAELCFRVGQSDQGFDILRRNVRSNPNDEEALLYMARMLADEFKTDEAIELYWRGFELANDIDGKTPVITALVELYLRTNRFESLIDRLEMTGREKNKPRDGLLWAAAAHQAAGDLGMARQMLEQLAREDSRDTKLLEQLVGLSRAEYDFESAAEYQKRLVAVAPSPKREYLLANILLELGEIDQAETLWLKLSQRKNDPAAFSNAISTLVKKDQLETAEAIVEKLMSKKLDDWEILAQAMIVYARLEKKDESRLIAERVLAMNVDPAEPTAKVKAEIEKRASRRNQKKNQYNRHANLGQPSRAMQNAPHIKQTLVPGSINRNYGGRQGLFTPTCFQDVQAMAYCMPLVANDKKFNESKFIKQFVAQALEEGQSEKLWQAILYQAWENQGIQYGQVQNESYQQCLEALVEKEDPYAAKSLLGLMTNRRQRNSRGNDSELEPLSEEELEQAKKWSALAANASQSSVNYYDLWLSGELERAGQTEAADKLIDQYVEAAKSSSNASTGMLQAMSLLLNEHFNKNPSLKTIEKARELFQESLEGLKLSKSGASSGYGRQFASLVDQLVKHDQLNEAIETVDAILQWQARQTETMRPSQRDRLRTSGGPISYNRVVNGSYIQSSIVFPPSSGYFGSESIIALYGLYEACKEDGTKLSKAKEQIGRWNELPGDDPYLQLVRRLAQASFAYWTEDREVTESALAAAYKLQLGGQFIELARTRLLYESGKYREALAVVESIHATNQRMLVDRELTILQLLLQLGDLERAKQSAQKLFVLRLDSAVEFKLADLMFQLGMPDYGDRMMGRIRRRAGGKQDTLVKLMTRYADANDNEAASEIARQVIRRTSPRDSQNNISSGNQQHEKAVHILAQAKQLEPLIDQYEKLVERSPKSRKLVAKLAAFYEAAGRREKAQALRMKAAENAPDDPRSLLAAGKQLAMINKHDKAVEKYIAAIVKSPDILNQNYYEMQSSFEKANAWEQLADAIVDEGIRKFSQSYRLNEICSQLAQKKNSKAINRLLLAGLTELQWNELSQMLSSLARADFEANEEVVKLLGEKLTAEDASFAGIGQNAYVWSRGSNGKTTGFINGIATIVASDEGLQQQVVKAMNAQLEKNEKALFPRALLGLVQVAAKDFKAVRKTVEPLCGKEKKTKEDARAIWCLASNLAHDAKQPELACDLLESVEDDSLWERNNSGFENTATSLLAYSYEKAERHAEARQILLERLKNAKIDPTQNQYNPGYGEYQYMNSLSGLSKRFLKMGYFAEAFIAYRKAYADEEMLQNANRWGGNLKIQKEQLKKQISEKIDADAIVKIVNATLVSSGEAEADSFEEIASYLTHPQVQRESLMNTRVTMLLEEFAVNIADDLAIRTAVSEWLKEHPLSDEEKSDEENSTPLKLLVSRLVISDAAKDEEEIAATSLAIGKWVSTHEVATPAGSEEVSETAESKSADNKSSPRELPEELLLGLAALRIPEAVLGDAEVVQMLERAVAVAELSGEDDLAGSLRCQIAKRISGSDPDRANAIFMKALDHLLPPIESSDSNQENEGSKS